MPLGKRIVHHEDIQQFYVQPFEHLLKYGIGLEDMNVDINGMDRCERKESPFFVGGFVGADAEVGA
jgi:hypothetical protein